MTAYIELLKYVNLDKDLKPHVKKAYEYNLSKMSQFDGKITNYKKVKEFLENNYGKTSSIKVLNVLVKYFKKDKNT